MQASTLGPAAVRDLTLAPRPLSVVVLGAGKIGRVIAAMLANTGDYRVCLVDHDAHRLDGVPRGVDVRAGDPTEPGTCAALLAGADAVMNALPFHAAIHVAAVAARLGVHYFDLTEDVAATHAIRALAGGARSVLMPQCGLAPGFIGVVGHDLAQRFLRGGGELHDLRMRVGALPRYPSNALKYNLTWSTEGLINEYCNPCEAIVDGRRVELPALEGHESFALDGVEYEAFNTSGGLGTLPDTLAGHARQVDYKSIRYPGHCAQMKLLLNDLRLRERREWLREIFEHAIPVTAQDVVVVFASATGHPPGARGEGTRGPLTQASFSARIGGMDDFAGIGHVNAIQLTTAAGICTALDLVAAGVLPQSGFVKQEAMPLDSFLANRFGQHYARHPLQETLA
ncbi:Saccharopine dehydrogenase, NADP-dependent [Ralstonia sp. 25mfcol4.1]|uniref:saccharopine dehydrogenase C-terminal domain-containing protein n=1 Tax=Burkholderiaceae TaxID=119060 RepID=UPI000880243D|nr:saccharopine dehydrogenase C-terminal domain-containing protein [Ralstonia sp. 25mfcol4.1]SDP63231.1 Saccharopine dehydrogenase, NADP-dependent [Ralstonia sp. 25mfcol4.1]